MHIVSLRASCSSQIPCSKLEELSTVLKPSVCGWTDDDGELTIHWMRSPQTRDAVLVLQSFSNQKQQEDYRFELGDSDDDID